MTRHLNVVREPQTASYRQGLLFGTLIALLISATALAVWAIFLRDTPTSPTRLKPYEPHPTTCAYSVSDGDLSGTVYLPLPDATTCPKGGTFRADTQYAADGD